MSKHLVVLVVLGVASSGYTLGQSNPATSSQVGPGDTSSIDHGKKTPAPDKPHRMLNDALTPQTRDRLQKAMDSAPTPAPAH